MLIRWSTQRALQTCAHKLAWSYNFASLSKTKQPDSKMSGELHAWLFSVVEFKYFQTKIPLCTLRGKIEIHASLFPPIMNASTQNFWKHLNISQATFIMEIFLSLPNRVSAWSQKIKNLIEKKENTCKMSVSQSALVCQNGINGSLNIQST